MPIWQLKEDLKDLCITHTYRTRIVVKYLNFIHNWCYLSASERESGPLFDSFIEDQESAKDQK